MSWHVHTIDEIMVSVLHRLWSIACSRRPMVLSTPIALHIQSNILNLCLPLALLPSVSFSKMCRSMPLFSRNGCPTMRHCLSLMVRISKQSTFILLRTSAFDTLCPRNAKHLSIEPHLSCLQTSSHRFVDCLRFKSVSQN